MTDKEWATSLEPLRTRSDARAFIATALDELITSGHAQEIYPTEIVGLSTGSDREVLESYHRVRAFCEGRSGRSRPLSGAVIGGKVRELFVMALDRMKKLPPEPVKITAIVSGGQVRRG
ncbi:MAG: hypothetical protein ACREUQ_03195 [Burkholderiales bacterium]